MQQKLLFNPDGDDSVQHRTIIKGNTTNIFNLNDVKYTWANKLYRVMMANFWIPEKVNLTMDILDYKKLTKEEQTAYDGILSFLVFLDSVQVNNIPNITDYVTAPEVSLVLSIQDYQEAIHSQSYAYTIETVVPKNKREKIYEFWRADDILLERNKYVAEIYQDFINVPSDENYFKVLVANYLLEGLYFYNGFNFFYNLSSRNLMAGTSDMIRYINRDELSHCVLFENFILTIKNEFPYIYNSEVIKEMFTIATQQEIRWTNHIIGSSILGISEDSTDRYTKWMANYRLSRLEEPPLFIDEKYEHNPYKHLEKIADTEGSGDVKGNFFESTISNYQQSSAVDGWNDF
jgi:ribonucleoside-diphosphate reductase beta chain